MDDHSEKIRSPKAPSEERQPPNYSKRSQHVNTTKDTTDFQSQSKHERSSEEIGIDNGKRTILNENLNKDIEVTHLKVSTIIEAATPSKHGSLSSNQVGPTTSMNDKTMSSISTPRRTTRSSGRKPLSEGLVEQSSPSGSTKSSGSKPLRDATGKFISTKRRNEDQNRTETPKKQAIAASKSPASEISMHSENRLETATKAIVPLKQVDIQITTIPTDGSHDTPSRKQVTASAKPVSAFESAIHHNAAIESSSLDQVGGSSEAAKSSEHEAFDKKSYEQQDVTCSTPPTVTGAAPTEVISTAINPLSMSKVSDDKTGMEKTEAAENPEFGISEQVNMTKGVLQAADEAAIYAARAPLTNLYGQYVCKSTDTCLDDARTRLKRAITQTRDLRNVFTERVYGKYRVCMKPPPETNEIIERILKDPVSHQRRLKEEMAIHRDEKEVEKVEAAKLNAEMAQSASGERASILSNVDNAEQVMYLTAGLNLVILPEDDVDPMLVQGYTDRGPVNLHNGQRVKNISQAAATAGEVILDRARKAAAMRVERQRRRQLQLLRGEIVANGETESNYSRLQVLTDASSNRSSKPGLKTAKSVPPTKSVAASVRRASSTTGSKSPKVRPQTTQSLNNLLNLNATADEIKIEGKPAAATVALMARGIGSAASKTTQQRLRHPHPDSLGGRRRAIANPTKQTTPQIPAEPFLHSNLANTLPPLPSVKDRLERKPMLVQTSLEARSNRATQSIKSVLNMFSVDSKRERMPQTVSKISLLKNLQNLKVTANFDQVSTPSDAPLNPLLTLSVLHALGVISKPPDNGQAVKPYSLPKVDSENQAMWSSKLKSLRSEIVSGGSKSNEHVKSSQTSCKRSYLNDNLLAENTKGESRKVSSKDETVASQPITSASIENICGESETLIKTELSGDGKAISTHQTTTAKSNLSEPPHTFVVSAENNKKRKRTDCLPVKDDIMAKHKPLEIALSCMNEPLTHAIGLVDSQTTAESVKRVVTHPNHIEHHNTGDVTGCVETQQKPKVYDASSETVFSNEGHLIEAISEQANTVPALQFRESHASLPLGGHPSGFNSVSGAQPAVLSTAFGVNNPYKRKQTLSQLPNQETSASTATPALFAETVEANRLPAISSKSIRHSREDGIKFSVPPAPTSLSSECTNRILAGKFHTAVEELEGNSSSVALQYLLTVGAAIPIPKGLIHNPLKERLSTPGFKNAGTNCAPLISREVVAAAILVWLWSEHEQTFKDAFEKNGRIDVDYDCKWLVQVAVDTAVGELSLEIAESLARGEGAFAKATSTRIDDSPKDTSIGTEIVNVHTASIISCALTVEMRVNETLNSVIVPKYQLFIEFLDESRIGALRAKSQERVLLGTLVTRKAMITESFAHAYVSAMVRAGEALGHGELFEISQDETTMASTMIPYDILTDEAGLWEDPCKPENGFTEGLSGDDLMRQAHARAILQKSLKKLQDRYHIRGGTTNYGPFDEHTNWDSQDRKAAPQPSPRPGPKRRFSSLVESVPQGTGSSQAKSWSVYEPNHGCPPLEWDPDILDNSPYGIHAMSNEKMRSLSLSIGRVGQESVRSKRSMSLSLSQSQQLAPRSQPNSENMILQSTRALHWDDVASAFQSVEVPLKTSRYSSSHDDHNSTPVFVDGTIFAPYYRKINKELSTDDDESDTEEDLCEEATLARHNIVLEEMKEKLHAYLEARKKQQEARKNKYNK